MATLTWTGESDSFFPLIVYGFLVQNGAIVPRENENSCFSLLRTIDNRITFETIYLPLIHKNME